MHMLMNMYMYNHGFEIMESLGAHVRAYAPGHVHVCTCMWLENAQSLGGDRHAHVMEA